MVAETCVCPCCGYPTLSEEPPGTYEICPVCFWEDDPVQFNDPSFAGGAGSAHLLPNYDEYFIGFRDRSALQGRVAASKIDVPAGVFLTHVVVVDGELVGGWKRSVVGGTVIVEVRLVVDVPRRAMSQVHAQVKRYGEFLGMPVEVEIVHPAPSGQRIDRRRAR